MKYQPFNYMLANDNITAVVINKNGSKTLRHCLRSLSWVGAVVLADDSSTDNSIQIGTQMGATIFQLHESSSFAQKRNEAMSGVTDGWVLFIDSDEEMSFALSREIKEVIQKDEGIMGWKVRREDFFMNTRLHFGETGNIRLIRLAKVGSGQWKRRVHEYWDVDGMIGELNAPLIHQPHPTISEFIEKINTYSSLEIKERFSSTSSFIPYRYEAELVIYPIAKFIKNVVLLQGYRDGFQGLAQAWCMSFHSLCVRIKTLEYIRLKKLKYE